MAGESSGADGLRMRTRLQPARSAASEVTSIHSGVWCLAAEDSTPRGGAIDPLRVAFGQAREHQALQGAHLAQDAAQVLWSFPMTCVRCVPRGGRWGCCSLDRCGKSLRILTSRRPSCDRSGCS